MPRRHKSQMNCVCLIESTPATVLSANAENLQVKIDEVTTTMTVTINLPILMPWQTHSPLPTITPIVVVGHVNLIVLPVLMCGKLVNR